MSSELPSSPHTFGSLYSHGFARVAAAVPRVRIGEPAFNAERTLSLARQAADDHSALVIFPEGGNWTPGRWRRGVRRLEQRGREDLAARARGMPNLLPPRTGGVLSSPTLGALQMAERRASLMEPRMEHLLERVSERLADVDYRSHVRTSAAPGRSRDCS